MSNIEKPKLRNLNVFPVNLSGKRMICLQDPFHFTESPIFVPENAFFIISLFDGENSILDIQEKYMRAYGDLLISDKIRKLAEELDNNLMLESERFEQHKMIISKDFAQSTVRLPAYAGKAYESDPVYLRNQIKSFFISSDGPGEINKNRPSANSIKAIISPHIDPLRGGTCYAWAYKEIAELCNAELFIIFGTSHSLSKNMFILTKKDFQTPFGMVNTDKDFVDFLVNKYKYDVFEDEFIHKFEHSIEFQIIFLQYVLGQERNYNIVPILCSSFHDMIINNILPSENPAISEFILALRDSIERFGKSVCFIAGADLSHIGKKFGDDIELSSGLLEFTGRNDLEMLKHVEQVDANGFFNSIQREGDERKICGLPPIYMLLNSANLSEGKLLKYCQAPEYNSSSVVSFASMSFS